MARCSSENCILALCAVLVLFLSALLWLAQDPAALSIAHWGIALAALIAALRLLDVSGDEVQPLCDPDPVVDATAPEGKDTIGKCKSEAWKVAEGAGAREHSFQKSKSEGSKSELFAQFALENGEDFEKLVEVDAPFLLTGDLAKELLSEDWDHDHFFVQYFAFTAGSNIHVSPAVDATPASGDEVTVKIREMTLDLALPTSRLCSITSTRATVMIRVAVMAGGSIVIESSVANHDVPFGSSFHVQERTLVKPSGPKGASVTKYWRIAWQKNVGFIKAAIRSGARNGTLQAAKHFCTMLQERHQSEGVHPVLEASVKAEKVEDSAGKVTKTLSASWREMFACASHAVAFA